MATKWLVLRRATPVSACHPQARRRRRRRLSGPPLSEAHPVAGLSPRCHDNASRVYRRRSIVWMKRSSSSIKWISCWKPRSATWPRAVVARCRVTEVFPSYTGSLTGAADEVQGDESARSHSLIHSFMSQHSPFHVTVPKEVFSSSSLCCFSNRAT